MELQLENLNYQETAIQAVVKVFYGTEKNTIDNACIDGIRSNFCNLSSYQLANNLKSIAENNKIDDETAKLSTIEEITKCIGLDACIEMETGTGKTLVYIKTIYELYKHYAFTKFIILVPSIAIRQGTLGTFNTFEKQLESIYGFKVSAFYYESKKLNKVTNFIEEQHPHVMIMTTAAFSSDERIFNRTQREGLFNNLPYMDAIAKLRPIIFMDEPQEGMDSDNMMERLNTLTAEERKERYSNKVDDREKTIFKTLDPLFKFRYSATHKMVKNLLYRLTPYDSYNKGLVKKIEVLTVTEKYDEATIKIELIATQNRNSKPMAKVKAWKLKSGKFVFEETSWLRVGDNLGEKTNNPSYLNYIVERINKNLFSQKWFITFTNGVELFENQASGNVENIWAIQLEWLIKRHIEKSQKLQSKGIKVLSLIFIDKVSNYMGAEPKIKNLFIEKYKSIYPYFNEGKIPTNQQIQDLQGYYFAQNAKGEYSDNEGGFKEQKKIYELILQKKDELLNIGNPIEFVFSHSALGVGWDNPNVFNIATLNTAYSEIRKRQEIGRGLRICVNQEGQRVYDDLNAEDLDCINLLTVIPNETYETFVTQYQKEIKDIYGTTSAGAGMLHAHKGKPQNNVSSNYNTNSSIDEVFKRFWKALAKKTDYAIAFDEESLIAKAIEQLNLIAISDCVAEVSSQNIGTILEVGIEDSFGGTETYTLKSKFTPLDLVEELSKNTGLSYTTLFNIIKNITNLDHIIKNPPQYIHTATGIIRNILLGGMLRGLDYQLTGDNIPFSFNDFVNNISKSNFVETPNRCIYYKMLLDSIVKYDFAQATENQPDIVCIIRLPSWYKIKTPIGEYEPDFGLVMKHKNLKSWQETEYYFVIETKGINGKNFLTESEVYKIKCVKKYFESLGVNVNH